MVVNADTLLTGFGLSKDQIKDINAGKLVNAPAPVHTDRELGVYLAMQVKENFANLKESFHTSPKVKESDDAVDLCILIEDANPDFSALKLDKTMIRTYQSAAPGSDVNLSKSEIASIKAAKGSGPEVEEALRKVLLERYRSYRANGLKGIGPYSRSSSKDYSPADDMKKSFEGSTIFHQHAPNLSKYIREYPNSRPEGVEESFFWIQSVVDDKTTISLMHHIGLQEAKCYGFYERQFYVSRSHNYVQGVGGAFALSDDESVVVYCTRTSTDQVAGFGGSAKKAIGSRIMAAKVAKNFEKVRDSFK